VHFSENLDRKYLSGIRKPISIRIDTGLYSAFKPISKRVYGSTCNAVEVYMIGLVETVERGGVYFSNTAKPLQIDKIVIERNIRERRKLEVEREITEKPVLGCGVADCKKPAVSKAIWLNRNQEYWLCQEHSQMAKSNPRLWKLVQ
jgi:hypothetical protein